ncbi:MAG: redoxin domain-containing protein [Planctomycetia bacterium]|nr:redoxin domain-containing protein [Planctomycetia bacterium]
MRTFVLTLTAVVALSAALVVSATAVVTAAPIKMPEKSSDRPQLKSIYAGTHSLTEFKRPGTKALAIVFICEHCPVAQRYVPRLQEMFAQYHKQGVEFLAVFPNQGSNIVQMATFAHDMDIPFPVLEDVNHKLADLLDARVTPEVIVLDANWEKRYQGAIDNQFNKRGQLREPTENYLRNALDAVLAGGKVETPETHASGCPIERQPARPAERKVTYYRDVAPILQANCQVCHRKGEVGPFELSSFDDAYDNATRIAEVVAERRMPPWHGYLNPEFGKLCNDKRLSDDQISIILDWVAQNAPAGNKAEAPKPIQWPKPGSWKIGPPDFVYKMPEPFLVPKSGVVEYQFFRVKLNLPEERWIQAIEIKPGKAEVVHHVALHLVPTGNKQFSGLAGMTALYGLNADKGVLLNDYVPGDTYNAKVYPAGQAVRIPPHSDLIYELHYTPNNREATLDQSMVGIRWAAQPPKEEVRTAVFRKPIGRFTIPPYDHHYRVEDTYYFEHDVYIDAVRPHSHLRGKSFRLEMVERDPKTDLITGRKTILTVPVYDANWQRTYEFETPLLLKAGTELVATGQFDNSWLNPNNPDPSATVSWGQQFWDEMFSTRFKYRLADPSGGATTPPAATAGLMQLVPHQ